LSRLTLAFGLVLLVVEASAATWIVATSNQDADTWRTIAVALAAGVMFVLAGLVALWRRPSNRTGVFLAATGYLWFLGALTAANDPWVFTFGWIVGGTAFVPLTALILVHPSGRFGSRFERAIPVAVAIAVTVPSFIGVLIDPTPASSDCSECPESALAVADLPRLAGTVAAIEIATALGLLAVLGALLIRRWRRASTALRRALLPVFVTGSATLASLFVVNIASELSGRLGDALAPLFLISLGLVPISFLIGLLRTRLARSSVGGVVVALETGTPLRDALAEALGDPTLQISYRLAGSPRWVDAEGHFVPEPAPAPGRAQTTIERTGLPIAVLDYDAHLTDDPELIDGVAAAAGLSLHNERLTAGLRAQYAFLETITDTAPSLLVNVDTDGRILNQNQAAVAAAGAADEDVVRGRYFWDVFIDESERDDVIARFQAAAPDFPATEYENTFTNELGQERVVYWRSAPVRDEDGKVVSIIAGGLDITERHRLEAEKEREREFLNAIANNAPSLLCLIDAGGRVADRATNIAFERTLEYDAADTGGHVFWERYVVPEEAAEVSADVRAVVQGEAPREHDNHWVTSSGRRLLIAWTCTPLPRIDERTLFLLSGVDVTARKQYEEGIRASRARIVQAGDDARRQLERNLHDGAQQRLVALSVALRLAESKLTQDPDGAAALLDGAREELAQALEELRELARGIHPAVLTDRGLGPALEALVGRAPIPVELSAPTEPLPAVVEAAAYYVVAEALTNVAKYGQAASAKVSVAAVNGMLTVTVADDGVGGAHPERGSGLRGLADRVEALEGNLAVESPQGVGTTVSAEIPLAGGDE
jgi:PAS domain S-box-containing protein